MGLEIQQCLISPNERKQFYNNFSYLIGEMRKQINIVGSPCKELASLSMFLVTKT